MRISIVIPAYNEARRLPASIRALRSFLNDFPQTTEVIIVVEKSRDATLEEARKAIGTDKRFSILANREHRGKGYAVQQGVLKATGDYIFFMDADLATSLESVGQFLAYFTAHPKVAVLVANRAHPKSIIPIRQSWARIYMGRVFNLLVQLITPLEIKDTQCGFKAFRKDAASRLFSVQSIHGFAFDVEILYLAYVHKYVVVDLPITWSSKGGSRMPALLGPLKMFLHLLVIHRMIRAHSKHLYTHSSKPLLSKDV